MKLVKIIPIFLAILLVLPFASAWEFDNVKQYSPPNVTQDKYGEITVTNLYGFGSDISKWRLPVNTELCADICTAEINLTLLTDYKDPFSEIYFKKLQNGKWVDTTIPYKKYIKTGDKEIVKPTYEYQCNQVTELNGTIADYCDYAIIGTHIEKEPIWSPYAAENFPAGNYIFKLEGKKAPHEDIDWQGKLTGVVGTEWAVWSGYNNASSKIWYYKFNQTSGSALDETGKYNASIVGTITYNQTQALSGFGNYSFSPAGGANILNTTHFATLAEQDQFSVEFRIKLNHTTRSYVMSSGTGADDSKFGWGLLVNTQSAKMTLIAMNGTAPVINEPDLGCPVVSLTNNEWHHVVVVKNSTNSWHLYQDGVRCTTVPTANMTQAPAYAFAMFGRPTGATGIVGGLDQVIWWNRTLSNAEVLSANASTGDGSTPSLPPLEFNTTLISPADKSNFTLTNHLFNASLSVNQGNFTNATLQIWNNTGALVNETTNNVVGQNTFQSTTWNITLTPGNYSWNVFGCSLNGTSHNCSFAAANFSLAIDNAAPRLVITFPTANHIAANRSFIQLNYTHNDTILSVASCWFNLDRGVNTSVVGCLNTNFSTIVGDHTLYLFANDTLNNVNETSVNFTAVDLNVQSQYPSSSIEGVYESFNQTINTSTNVLVSPSFVYNSTVTTTGITNESQKYIARILTPTVTAINESKNFYWSFNLTYRSNSQVINTSTLSNTVVNSALIPSNATFPYQFLNFTFEDEVTGAKINGTLSTSLDFFLSSSNSSSAQTTFYSNNTENPNYPFSGTPQWATYTVNGTIIYASTIVATYPQRTISYGPTNISNATTNQILYLLKSTDGSYVTIIVVSQAGAPITGVTVSAIQVTSGINSGTYLTDSSGSATFWTNPNYDYLFTISKTGYTTAQTTIRPSQSTYTVILSNTNTTATFNASLQGITYRRTPTSGILAEGNYIFTYNVSSIYNNIEGARFELVNYTDFQLAENSSVCTSSGCYLTINFTTSQNMRGKYYVNISGAEYKLEGDANWYQLTWNDTRTNLGTALNQSRNLADWGEGGRSEFSRITFFFLAMALLLALMNFYSLFDSTNPGMAMMFTTLAITAASIGGFFTIPDAFPSFPWLDQYMIALTFWFYMGGRYIKYKTQG